MCGPQAEVEVQAPYFSVMKNCETDFFYKLSENIPSLSPEKVYREIII